MILFRGKIDRIYFPLRAAEFRRKKSYCQIKSERHRDFSAIRLRRGSPGFPGRLKAAFISDLHYQERHYHERIIDSVCRFLEQEKCDLLILGGDGCGDACFLDKLPEVLKKFSCCAPVSFAVPGNWELGKSWITLDRWREIYFSGGFKLLSDSFFCGENFFLGGLSDCRKSEVLPHLPEIAPEFKGFKLLVSHNVDSALAADNYERLSDYDLVLCGHNHGGQMRLPGVGTLLSGSIYGRKFDYGLYGKRDRSKPEIFISSGLGEGVVPFRIGCRREVVIVECSATT